MRVVDCGGPLRSWNIIVEVVVGAGVLGSGGDTESGSDGGIGSVGEIGR